MLIRIKYDGKSRKLSEKVSTVAELRNKIKELFGGLPNNAAIVYKDCDGENVNVIDDEDLRNCFNEANDLKQTSLTFLIQHKSSSENQANNSWQCSSEDESVSTGAKPAPSETKRTLRESDVQNLKKILFKMDFLSRESQKKNLEDPMLFLKSVLKGLEKECPGISVNPCLLSGAFTASRAEIIAALKDGYVKSVTANPELPKSNDEWDRLWRDTKKAHGGFLRVNPSHHHDGHDHRDGGRSKRTGNARDEQPRDIKLDADTGNSNERINVPAPSPQRSNARDHADRDEYRKGGYSRGGPSHYNNRDRDYNQDFRQNRFDRYGDRERRQRQTDYHPASYTQHDPETEDKVHDRVRRLCHQFPQKSKMELRAIVEQNLDKTLPQLESLITNSRKAKSARSYY
jgi:PB1 domain